MALFQIPGYFSLLLAATALCLKLLAVDCAGVKESPNTADFNSSCSTTPVTKLSFTFIRRYKYIVIPIVTWYDFDITQIIMFCMSDKTIMSYRFQCKMARRKIFISIYS